MTAAETPQRQEKVERYDTTVQEWNDIKREQFAASSFSISAPLLGAAVSINLVEELTVDPHVQNKDGKPEMSNEILEYTPMKYHMSDDNSHFAGINVNFTSNAPAPSAQFVLSATYKGVTSEINLDSFLIHKHKVQHVYGAVGAQRQRCNGMHGTLKNGIGAGSNGCRIFQRLKSVCVEVELDSNDKWQLRRRDDHKGDMQHNLNYGCNPMTHWAPADYEYLHLSAYGQQSPPASTLSAFQFHVRSAADPFLELESLTDNSFFFGMSQHQQRITGGVCIGIGLLVCISPLLWLWHCYKSSRDDYHDESEPFTFYDVSGTSKIPARDGMSADQYVDAYLGRDGDNEAEHEFAIGATHEGQGEEYGADDETMTTSREQIPLDRMEIELSHMNSGVNGEDEDSLADIPDMSPVQSPSAGKFSDAEDDAATSVSIDIESKPVGDGNGKLLQRKRI